MRNVGRFVLGESGQMAVEVAALMPVIIVAALVTFNLARFLTLCATFDRVALDAVVLQGASPAEGARRLEVSDRVRLLVEDALDSLDCDVMVSVDPEGGRVDGGGECIVALDSSPKPWRFTCTLVFRPWPSFLAVAGVSGGTPLSLRHVRSFVVDSCQTEVVGK